MKLITAFGLFFSSFYQLVLPWSVSDNTFYVLYVVYPAFSLPGTTIHDVSKRWWLNMDTISRHCIMRVQNKALESAVTTKKDLVQNAATTEKRPLQHLGTKENAQQGESKPSQKARRPRRRGWRPMMPFTSRKPTKVIPLCSWLTSRF